MGHSLREVAEADPADVSAVASRQDPVVQAAPLTRFVPDAGPDGAAHTGAPPFRCGRCLAKIQQPLVGHAIRCASCGSRLLVPARVRLRCRRCGHHHRIHPSALGTEHLCAVCANPLAVKEVVLLPSRHHHRERRRTRPVRREPHDRAVSTMLLVGLTLIAATMLLIQL